MHQNIELGERYGLDLNAILDPETRDEGFRTMIRIAKGILAKLNAAPVGAVSYSGKEYREKSIPSNETVERFNEFSTRLTSLMDEFGLFEDNDLLSVAYSSFRRLATDCDNSIELNLEIESNLHLQETVSKKQMHKDYIQLRMLLVGMAASFGYKLDLSLLPAKSGNYSDDLPVISAQAAFHSHSYEVEVFEPVVDGNGRVMDYEVVDRHAYTPGTSPIRLALHLKMFHLLTKSGFLAWFAEFTKRFGIRDFEELESDFSTVDDPYVYEQDGRVYCLHINPVPGKAE